MSISPKSDEQLLRENENLLQRLEEAEETIRAISGGEVDAFIVHQGQGEQVLLLGGADRPYRLLVEKMQQGAATITPDGTFAYVNRRFAELLGVSLDSLIGTEIANYVSERTLPFLEALLTQGSAGGSQGELEFQRFDGQTFPVHMSVSPLLEEAGVFCLILTDLSNQRRHDALVASETLSRSILDQAVDAIVVCDTLGKVIRASRSAQILCNRNPLLQPFTEVFPLLMDDEKLLVLDSVLKGITLRGVECRLPFASGYHVELQASAGPVWASDQSLLGCVVTLTDITRQKQLEKDLRYQAKQLSEGDRRKDQFLAMLAHELRNPLAPIRNGLHILNRKGVQDIEVVKIREMMGRQLENLIRLVDDLLDVSRITQGKINLKKERLDLGTVVMRGVESSRPFIDEKGHQLEVNIPDEPLPVEGDAVRLAQIILNLLNNAAKFTPRGGTIWLTIEKNLAAVNSVNIPEGQQKRGTTQPEKIRSEKEKADSVVIRVQDSGVGISPELLPRVFDLFTQADDSPGRSEGGLGVGLTLVRYLAEMHNGHVEVHSDGPGRGSEFVLRLPLASAERFAEIKAPEKPRTEPVTGLRILIVDDNHDSGESLATLLKLMGHQVFVSEEGTEALAKVKAYSPQIILLDIGLPGMDGYEVARRIRIEPENNNILLVALTGYGSEEDRRLGRSVGFDHHLVKPVDLDSLENLLSQAFSS